MPDFGEIPDSLGGRSRGPNLDELKWRGGFDGYLRAVAARPELLRGLRSRLLQARGKCFPDPAGAIAAALETLAPRPEAPRWALLLECESTEGWSEWIRLSIERFEGWTCTGEGALFAFRWLVSDGDGAPAASPSAECPIRELPFRLVPEESRRAVLAEISGDVPIRIQGPLCPECERIERSLLRKYRGDWRQMIAHVEVYRLLATESGGRCIGRARWESLGVAARDGEASGETGDPSLSKSWWPGVFVAANRGLLCIEREPGECAPEEFWRALEWILEPGLSPAGSSKDAPLWIACGSALEYAVLCPLFRGEDFGEIPASLREKAVRASLGA